MDSPDLFAAARECVREISSPPDAAPDDALVERAGEFLERSTLSLGNVWSLRGNP